MALLKISDARANIPEDTFLNTIYKSNDFDKRKPYYNNHARQEETLQYINQKLLFPLHHDFFAIADR